MMSIFPLILFAVSLSLCTIAHAGGPLPHHATDIRTADYASNTSDAHLKPQLVRTLNRLGLQLLADLDANGGDNVFISPASVSSALSLLQLGVTTMSDSASEIRALIGSGFTPCNASSDPDVEFLSANSVWTSTSVLETYKSRVMSVLGAKVCPLPSNVSVINEWVSDATNGNIPILFEQLPDEDIVAILINAIFFRAPWKIAFDPANTVDNEFFGPSGELGGPAVTQVRMMRLMNEEFKYAEVSLRGMSRKSVQVVELDYGSSGDFAATIVVPTGRTTLEEAMMPFQSGNVQVWSRWTERLTPTRLRVLALPRFRIEFGVESLKASLRRLGVNAPFDSVEADPQLLRLTSDPKAFVDDVFHKTTLEVTEEGTEASAATAVTIFSRSAVPTVVLNRPFLFAIRNLRSGALLFIGKINVP